MNAAKDRRKWDGIERRKIEGGRRTADFCSEHCMLKKIYRKEFDGISDDMKEIRTRKQKGFEAVDRAITKLEKRHIAEVKDLKDDVENKAPLKIMLWIIGTLVTYLVMSTVVLWTKLSTIEKDVAVIKHEQERVVERHSREENLRRNGLYYDYRRNNTLRNGNGRDVRNPSN
jgi:hypothetical protein